MELNSAQLKCVNSIDGVYNVISGPGSGKTSTLVQRYLTMLMRQIPPTDILNLTFTNAGANQMIKKVGITDVESVFRTFHSLALEILKKEREYVSFPLCDTVIPVEMQNFKLLFDLIKVYPAIKNWESLQDKISTWKSNGVSPDQALEQTEHRKSEYFFALAYRDYARRSRAEGWLDFDGLIEETINLLESNPEVRQRWQRKYIQCDEFQDTDGNQTKLLQLLFNGNIMAYGDEGQCIYEFRSAKPGNLTNFHQHFPGSEKLFLGKNYRSTKKLVSFFKKVIPVDNGIANYMETDNHEGVDPTFTKYLDDHEESEEVLKKASLDPTHSVIIARTNRQLFKYQKLCALKGIKYKFLGKKDYFEQSEIKRLLELAKKSNRPGPAHEVLQTLIREHRLLEIYDRQKRPMENSPTENLNDIVKMAANKGDLNNFLNWLRKVMYARQNAKGLTLGVVHQVKGMEFDKVFFVGCDQGIVPHDDGELNEESRIFYVGVTRSAQELHISFTKELSMFVPEEYRDMVVEFEPVYV